MPEDGYPTDEDLNGLDTFEGTPEAYVEYLNGIMSPTGVLKVELKARTRYNMGPSYEVRYVTGGWSGNEEIISRMEGEGGNFGLFNFRYWESIHRGGLYVFSVPEADWTKPTFLGLLNNWQAARAAEAAQG